MGGVEIFVVYMVVKKPGVSKTSNTLRKRDMKRRTAVIAINRGVVTVQRGTKVAPRVRSSSS
jgi:hypothetical protein